MPSFSGKTVPHAVLGHPIGHSLSPVMHNAAFRELGLDAVYLALDVPPDNLSTVLQAMQAMRFGGVNVTIPLKEIAFESLEQLDAGAELLGAVNTVHFTDDGPVGYNTDGYGFVAAVREDLGLELKGLNVLIIGAGGAGRAVALTAARSGAAAITVCDTDEYRVEAVAQEIHHLNAIEQVDTTDDAASATNGMDLIVQATPVGMKPEDPSLLPPDAFHEGQAAFDLIYMYPQTAFMKAAAEAGARTANGLGMLLHQGARAFEIWTGQKAPVDVMRNALKQAVYG